MPRNLLEIVRWSEVRASTFFSGVYFFSLPRLGTGLTAACVQDKVYAAFGIPPGMFTATGQKVSNSTEIGTLFQSQVQRVRTQVEDCMNDSLRLCETTNPVASVWGGHTAGAQESCAPPKSSVSLLPVPRCVLSASYAERRGGVYVFVAPD